MDDEDLVDGEPLKAQPITVRTGMSFQLARLKFAEITHKQIWQANLCSRVPYSFVYVFFPSPHVCLLGVG